MSTDEQKAYPQVGDLWTLSWNAHESGSVIIISVNECYVTVLPLTDADHGGIAPAVTLNRSRTGTSSMTMWTQLPTGIGMHLLSKKIRYVFTKPQIDLILSGNPQAKQIDGISFDFPEEEAVLSGGFIHGIISRYASLCHNEWPSARYGEGILDKDVLDEYKATPMQIMWSGAASTREEATALFEGKLLPDEAQVGLIAKELGVEQPLELLRGDDSTFSDILMTPAYKGKIHQLMLSLNITERKARSLWLRSVIESDTVYPSRVNSDFELKLSSTFGALMSGNANRRSMVTKRHVRSYDEANFWP